MELTAAQFASMDLTLPQFRPNHIDSNYCTMCKKYHSDPPPVSGLRLRYSLRPPNPDFVVPKLYISNIWTAAAYLNGCDSHFGPAITHILSIIADDCIHNRWIQSTKTSIKHIKIYLSDRAHVNIIDYFPEICRDIQEAVNTPNSRVLVHCYAGRSRSATAVIAYLVWARHMTVQQALVHLQGRRSWCMPNSGFMAQLRLWRTLNCNLIQPPMNRPMAKNYLADVNDMIKGWRIRDLPIQTVAQGNFDVNDEDKYDEDKAVIFKKAFVEGKIKLRIIRQEMTRVPDFAALRGVTRPRKLA